MQRAKILDAQEDRLYGYGIDGNELPDELRRRQDRLGKTSNARL